MYTYTDTDIDADTDIDTFRPILINALADSDSFENFANENRELIRNSITDEYDTLGLSWIFEDLSTNNIKKIFDPKHNIITSELLNKQFPNNGSLLHMMMLTRFGLFEYMLNHPLMLTSTIERLDHSKLSIFHWAGMRNFNKSYEALDCLLRSPNVTSDFVSSLVFEQTDIVEQEKIDYIKAHDKYKVITVENS